MNILPRLYNLKSNNHDLYASNRKRGGLVVGIFHKVLLPWWLVTLSSYNVTLLVIMDNNKLVFLPPRDLTLW